MRLKSVRVGEFKSIVDSGEFEIGDVTCLVGKNEAGKTALLEALYRLRPVIDNHGNFNVTHDYPRTDVEDYEYLVQTGDRQPATVTTAVYELSDDELAEVEGQVWDGCIGRSIGEALARVREPDVFRYQLGRKRSSSAFGGRSRVTR